MVGSLCCPVACSPTCRQVSISLTPKIDAPRLAFVVILQCVPGQFVVLLGVVCSTWVAINAGTSRRNFLCPMGNESVPSVARANIMVARTGHVFKFES